MKAINWAIMGAGHVSHKFAKSFHEGVGNSKLHGVASRTLEKAEEFAGIYSIEKAYGTYEQMLQDEQVDMVYIGSPHGLHKEHVLMCIEHGKGVLCEKAFCINQEEAKTMVEAAQEKGTFLMEAMWTRFLPATRAIEQYIKDGHLGKVRFIKVNIGFDGQFDPEWRLYKKDLGGGAILDIGIYAMAFISMLKGAHPTRVKAVGKMAPTEVDRDCLAILQYADGSMAEMLLSIGTEMAHQIEIIGTKGTIIVPSVTGPRSAYLVVNGKKEELVQKTFDDGYTGFEYQIREVESCIKEGKLASDRMSLEETIAIMGVLDRIREEIGLVYPNDK